MRKESATENIGKSGLKLKNASVECSTAYCKCRKHPTYIYINIQ